MDTVLKVEDLKVWFPVRSGFLEGVFSGEEKWVKAVDGISFEVRRGEIFCLVGESGCGKTTTGKAIVNLVEPSEGHILYQAKDQELEEIRLLRRRAEEIRRAIGPEDLESAIDAAEPLMKDVRRLRAEMAELKATAFHTPEEQVDLRQLDEQVGRLREMVASNSGDERLQYRLQRTEEHLEALRSSRRPLNPLENAKAQEIDVALEALRQQGGLALELLESEDKIESLLAKYHVSAKRGRELKELRRKLQMVFQDPYESLNPKHSIFDIVAEPLVVNKLVRSPRELESIVAQALEDAGLRPANDFMFRFPHELSGGQRQRVGVAAALVVGPEFIVADEPVSMLDASVRTEILKLLLDLREKKDLTFIFITHDLSLAWVLADRIAVLYLGRIVEMGPITEVIQNPRHPYTKALISVVPSPDPTKKKAAIILKGERPDPIDIPAGCRFHPRCPMAIEICGWEARDLRVEFLGLMEAELRSHVRAITDPIRATMIQGLRAPLEAVSRTVEEALEQLPPPETPDDAHLRDEMVGSIRVFLKEAQETLERGDSKETQARLSKIAERLFELGKKALAKEVGPSLRRPLEALGSVEDLSNPPTGINPSALRAYLRDLYQLAEENKQAIPPVHLMIEEVEAMEPEGMWELRIVLRDDGDEAWASFETWMREQVQSRLKEKVAFRAITGMAREAGVISFRLREVSEPLLKEVAPGTSAACVLV